MITLNSHRSVTKYGLIDFKFDHRRQFLEVQIPDLIFNAFAGKFDQFKLIIQNKLDDIVITETKLNDSYPNSQIFIESFRKPYRMDRNKFGGSLLIYIREDIQSKQLFKHNFTKDLEGMFIEANLRKNK